MIRCMILSGRSAGLFLLALPALAQLMEPNNQGASAGHHIIIVRDLEASNRFWAGLGGQPTALGTLKLTKFPGILLLVRQGQNQGGTEGSSVAALGFKVKDMKQSLLLWEGNGIKPVSATKTEAWLLEPNGIKVHVRQDKKLTSPVASDTLEMSVPDVGAARDWYAKWFGSPIPGANPVFQKASTPAAPTKGRSFDRIGIEMKGLEDFCKKLEASGIKLDGAYRKAANLNLAVCLLTDPFGTYIELSEGLAAVQ
jgi:hypothetical protein